MSASASGHEATARELSERAKALYDRGSLVMRAMQHYRPYISPFGALINAVPFGSRVLDIGCGGGLFLALLAQSGRIQRGLGIDTSAPAIAIAQDMSRRLGHSGIHFEARSASLPLPDEGYDVVTLLDVMHHIPPQAQQQVFLQALARVEPGGLFIYKDMVSRPLWRAAANGLHDLVIARQWIHYAPLAEVIKWAASAGAHAEVLRRIDTLWYGHEIVVFRVPR